MSSALATSHDVELESRSVLIVTAQSPEDLATRTRAAAAFVIETLEPRRE